MSKSSKEQIRNQLAGLGSGSIRKSYYQELQKKKEALEVQNKMLQDEILRRRDAEESLQQINEELEDRVERRTRELRKMQEAIVDSEKMRSLAQLLIGLSHEINTPLGNALTSVTFNNYLMELLAEQGELNQDGINLLKDIGENNTIVQRGIEAAIVIVNKLREITSEHEDQRKKPINMAAYLERVVDNYKFVSNTHSLNVNFGIDDDLQIEGYSGVITSVINELLENSVKHGSESIDELVIDISCQRDESRCQLMYQDNGNGIDEAIIKNVFDPFFTTAMSSEHSGLGLYVVYNLVKKVNGTIQCSNLDSGGLGFTIEFEV